MALITCTYQPIFIAKTFFLFLLFLWTFHKSYYLNNLGQIVDFNFYYLTIYSHYIQYRPIYFNLVIPRYEQFSYDGRPPVLASNTELIVIYWVKYPLWFLVINIVRVCMWLQKFQETRSVAKVPENFRKNVYGTKKNANGEEKGKRRERESVTTKAQKSGAML